MEAKNAKLIFDDWKLNKWKLVQNIQFRLWHLLLVVGLKHSNNAT
jgi:hypothetical protein